MLLCFINAAHSTTFCPCSSRWVNYAPLSFSPPASGREEVGGSVQAARLGCEDHTALVQAAAQPGEAQHPGPLLRKHVSQRVQRTRKQVHFIYLRASPRLYFLHFQFLRRFSVGLPVTDKTFSASVLSFEKLILIRSSLAQP